MKLLVAILLLCSTAFAVDPSTGPLFSIWHIDGHGYQWQVEQVSAGLPLEPSIRMAAPYGAMSSTTASDLQNPAISQFNRMPLALRMNNITNELDDTFPRPSVIGADTYLSSFLQIRRLPDGTYDDTPTPSPFADSFAWAEAGRRWATSPWMVALQAKIPAPTSIILRENNEGPKPTLGSLYVQTRVRWYRADNNTIQFANLNTPREKWLYDSSTADNQIPIVGDQWQILSGNTEDQLFVFRWRSDAELDGIDQRAKEWVGPRRVQTPTAVYGEWWALWKGKYTALFGAFRDNLYPAWRSVPFRTVGYNWTGEHDTGSLQTYTGYYRPAALTDAAHRKEIADRRALWSKNMAWRELSIRLRGPTVYTAAQNGTGDFVDAESYAGFNLHWCWAMQALGKEVRLVWWESYLTKPEYRVTGDNATWSATLNALGRPDLNAMTVGQCEVAIMQRMREIHEHKTLRKYWQQGTTELLPSSQNTTTLTRVYATATTLPDSPRKLLAVYTPCRRTDFSVELNAGQWNVPYARFAYYLTDPLVPLPPPTLTVEERLDRLELQVFGQSEDSE